MSMEKIFNFTVDKENLLVTIERSFEAPLDMVWAAWTEAELLAQWWAPKPWKAVTKDMDFREGGRWLYAMTGPDGQKAWDMKTFLKIDAKKSFTYRSTFTDENGTLTPETQGSIWVNTFTERDGGTRVISVIRNESLERLEALIKMGFKEGYTMGLNQLEELLAQTRKEQSGGMGKLVAIMSMSLDGFVAGPGDDVMQVFDWYFNSGNVEVAIGGSDPMTFRVAQPSADHLHGFISELGAMLTGRRTFEKAEGWGGNHAWGPSFVLAHDIPAGWPKPGSTVHFVTDGLESAVRQAKAAAGGKTVGVHGANVIQQLLNAGLLDEIHVDIAAVLLGSGIRLFDYLAAAPVRLGNPVVHQGAGVTHLRYPVLKD